MPLIKADAMFKVFPAKVIHKQQVKLRPNEHHYEKEGEAPYIKYSCQICEQLANRVKELFPNSPYSDDEDDEGGEFARFSFPEGTKRCPCCGINIDWDYKKS